MRIGCEVDLGCLCGELKRMDNMNRRQIEMEFHDRKAFEDARVDFYTRGILSAADRYAYELLGNLREKVVLDLGCGSGHHAVKLAEQGGPLSTLLTYRQVWSRKHGKRSKKKVATIG